VSLGNLGKKQKSEYYLLVGTKAEQLGGANLDSSVDFYKGATCVKGEGARGKKKGTDAGGVEARVVLGSVGEIRGMNGRGGFWLERISILAGHTLRCGGDALG